jgi:hypothetical protein
MSPPGVRREKAALSSGANPTRPPLQPEATGAAMEETKWLKIKEVSVCRDPLNPDCYFRFMKKRGHEMNNEIVKGHNGSLEAQSATQPVAQPTSIPNAVESVMAGLKQALTDMKADDISVELSAHQEGQRSSARFSIRAYRPGHRVVDESCDDKGE